MPNTKIVDETLYARALDDLRYMTLEHIEERLIIIEEEKVEHAPHPYSLQTLADKNKIINLEKERAKLQLKRQFILDKRNNWKAKLLWSFIIPVVVSMIVSIITPLVFNRLIFPSDRDGSINSPKPTPNNPLMA
ncbi:MAG: hypothetical protein Q8P01_02755 [bacterium]|nr:hypothetical protein [bacterium]